MPDHTPDSAVAFARATASLTASGPQSVNSVICSSVAGIDDRDYVTGTGSFTDLVQYSLHRHRRPFLHRPSCARYAPVLSIRRESQSATGLRTANATYRPLASVTARLLRATQCEPTTSTTPHTGPLRDRPARRVDVQSVRSRWRESNPRIQLGKLFRLTCESSLPETLPPNPARIHGLAQVNAGHTGKPKDYLGRNPNRRGITVSWAGRWLPSRPPSHSKLDGLILSKVTDLDGTTCHQQDQN